MTRWTSLMIALCLLGAGRVSMAQTPIKSLAQFPGSALKWLRAAEPVLQRQHLNEDDLDVEIIDGGKSVYVTLTPPNLPNTARDGGGYQIEINKKDMKILSAHYVR